ncbi:MAG: ABC transporter ATP-binding protein [Betaproteobacteria bacterium]
MHDTGIPALKIQRLAKSFNGKIAVDNLDLEIPAGQFHALLGPNGAGKTTTLRMVAGLLKADSGVVSIFGHDVASDATAARKLTAFLPDDPLLYGKLNALEYLEFVAGLWTISADTAGKRAEELLKWLDLWDHRAEYVEGFSRGMRQKLALAGALIHEPRLLILDEPLTGLDAHAARSVKDMLVDYVKRGNTVLLTTHILEIAERLAEQISIIQKGRIVAQGTLDELRARAGAGGDGHNNGNATLEDVFLNLTEMH